jgi:hypothetical protein
MNIRTSDVLSRRYNVALYDFKKVNTTRCREKACNLQAFTDPLQIRFSFRCIYRGQMLTLLMCLLGQFCLESEGVNHWGADLCIHFATAFFPNLLSIIVVFLRHMPPFCSKLSEKLIQISVKFDNL